MICLTEKYIHGIGGPYKGSAKFFHFGKLGDVQVVSVKPAQQDLINMLKEDVESAARGDGSTRPKTNSGGSGLTVTPLSAVELMSVRTSTPPIRNSGSRTDLLDLSSSFSDMRMRHDSGSSVGGSSVGGSSVFSGRTRNYSGSSHGDPAASSQIRLSHNHQHIEFQFCQKFLKDVLTDDFIDNCKFE
ncbi:hypothetical protein EB796_013105 [Bugula neritina]|uniref:Uncharacterized protein n=1 Tax=Bugula neritina TaxID=10212 RepID=A0A7J7JRQ8_BUGNE|nr:hypothetical protein EB796_013105 [Bugula neritina]